MELKGVVVDHTLTEYLDLPIWIINLSFQLKKKNQNKMFWSVLLKIFFSFLWKAFCFSFVLKQSNYNFLWNENDFLSIKWCDLVHVL